MGNLWFIWVYSSTKMLLPMSVDRQGTKRYKHMIGYALTKSYGDEVHSGEFKAARGSLWTFLSLLLQYVLSKFESTNVTCLTTEWMFYSICLYCWRVCVWLRMKTKACCCGGGAECLSRMCIQVCFQHFFPRQAHKFWVVIKKMAAFIDWNMELV